ncbi:MAG TPA: diacylglycerol kinase family protein [Acidimicrobiia bacterium]|nr:diacylglycerol kinase family protein [Acidimicrobiia bacterium]
MRWTAVVNPSAGRGRTRRMLPTLTSELTGTGADVDVRVAADVDETASIAREAFAQDRGVLVCGGDGTVALVAGIAAECGGLVGIVPTGAGNDFARTLGIRRRNLTGAVRTLSDGHEITVDLGRVDGRWFCSVANTGFDAEVNRWANEVRRLSGTALYLAGVARTLAVYRPRRFRVRVDDGEPRDVDAWLLAVGNGPVYGGGMQIAPDARLDDGVFDVCVIGRISVPGFVVNFPRVFAGTHTKHPAVSVLRGATVTIESLDGGIDLYASGERVGPLPARLETVPRALRVMVPRDSAIT